jgi:trans-aconitate 2-methyltransferase
MSRIPNNPKLIYDLGCGTGELTNLLASRWPDARVIGIDSSEAMLAKTQPRENVTFVRQDIRDWKPETAPELIFSNAVLHWLPHHETLFPRLLGELPAGGVFAVQMPDNWNEPTHRIIYQAVDERGWADRLDGHLLRNPVATVSAYLEWLAAADEVDTWRTTYYQTMHGDDPVLSWVRGSVLVPVQSILDEEQFSELLNALANGYRKTYPPSARGVTTLPISRLFLVAIR